jgi:hypothetical protein
MRAVFTVAAAVLIAATVSADTTGGDVANSAVSAKYAVDPAVDLRREEELPKEHLRKPQDYEEVEGDEDDQGAKGDDDDQEAKGDEEDDEKPKGDEDDDEKPKGDEDDELPHEDEPPKEEDRPVRGTHRPGGGRRRHSHSNSHSESESHDRHRRRGFRALAAGFVLTSIASIVLCVKNRRLRRRVAELEQAVAQATPVGDCVAVEKEQPVTVTQV